MQLIWILLKGYVIIRIDGVDIERFINICVHRKVVLFEIERKNGYVILKLLANNFKVIRSIARKTCCKVKILDKKGFPFFFRRYKKRKSFFIGVIIFLIIFAWIWSYIWEIEITGDSILKKKDVVNYLAKKNIGVGSVKYFLDTNKIEDDFMLHFKNLAWVDIKIKGTKLVISAVDRAKIPDIVNENEPCDIVAKKDGIVTEVLVKNGIETIKVGDAVLKGDVLISGIIVGDLENSESNIVHAIGSVKARTWYENQQEVFLIKTKKIYKGKVLKVYRLEFLNKELLKFKFGKGYNNYDKKDKVIRLKLLKNFVLPLKIKVEERFFYDNKQEVVSVDEAKKDALNRAINDMLKKINKDASILKQQVDYFYDRGRIFVKVLIETCEDIGVEQAIQ